jgi:hypothetical protein
MQSTCYESACIGPEESERLRTVAPDMAPRRSSLTRSTVTYDTRTACRTLSSVWPGDTLHLGGTGDVPSAGLMAA